MVIADLNSMKVRPPGVVMRDIIQEDPRTGLMMTVARVPQIDYADHPLGFKHGCMVVDF